MSAKTLAAIRAAGCTCGLTLKPGTPFSACEPFLDQIDLFLVMTVEPGFGGQPFMPEMMDKVRAAAADRAREPGLNFRIEVDGGINLETARIAVGAGADTLVAGTSVFGSSDMAAAVSGMGDRKLIKRRSPPVCGRGWFGERGDHHTGRNA